MWWLVSPQNPLKARAGMLPFPRRLAAARRFVDDPRIEVTGLEARLGTRYTCDTLIRLRQRAPRAHFVWLMGADNMATIHRWHRWPEIFATVPVAVFDRAPYSFSCLASRAAIRFRASRLDQHKAMTLATRQPPVWTYIMGPRHPASATAIRAGDTTYGFARQDDGTTC